MLFRTTRGARSKIMPKADTTQIRLSQATYNYVEFRLELLERIGTINATSAGAAGVEAVWPPP
jgi:hypothetical protein